MPLYLIRNGDEPPKYATIAPNGRDISWRGIEEATSHPSAAAAEEAFEAACKAAIKHAKDRVAAAKAKGTLVPVACCHGKGWAKPAEVEKVRLAKAAKEKQGRRHYGEAESKANAMEFYAPLWLVRKTKKEAKFAVASRATADDLMGVFDTFFVRGDHGWLGRPARVSQGAMLAWSGSFSAAMPFSSKESAQAELRLRGVDGHVVKTSCVFTEVAPFGKPAPDPVSRSIASACEARDIEGELRQSAADRLAAMKLASGEASAAPAKPARARL